MRTSAACVGGRGVVCGRFISTRGEEESVYKYFVLFSHEICHQKFSDRKAGSLEEEIENCA